LFREVIAEGEIDLAVQDGPEYIAVDYLKKIISAQSLQ
jgi:hypothetical protein